MANINNQTDAIKRAVYGEQVRDAIIEAITKVNDDNNSFAQLRNDTVAAVEESSYLHGQLSTQNAHAAANIAALQSENQISDAILNGVSEIMGYIGYTDTDIYGLEVDFENNRFTRLAGAVGLTAGADFDNIAPWQRRRCILAHDGTVLAYHGDAAYTDNGFLLQGVAPPGEVIRPAGTPVNVMVEQPPYYYKVVPLKLEKINDYYVIRKARYYISTTPKAGFELHPAFDNGTAPIYLSAYASTLYNTASGEYETFPGNYTDSEVDVSTYSIASIADGNVLLSSRTFSGIDASTAFSTLCGNVGLQPQSEVVLEMTQLLFLIEYASFNAQQCVPTIGTAVGGTGATSSLGNTSGSVNGGVSYRGEEALWGYHPYSCNAIAEHYKAGGYISAYIYIQQALSNGLFSEVGECRGTSISPVGDNSARHGGDCIYHGALDSDSREGLFAIIYSSDYNAPTYTMRFCYAPSTQDTEMME